MINDMIKMAWDLQRESLEAIATSRPEDVQFAEDLKRIYDDVDEEETEEDEMSRVAAEERVMCVVQEHGERIGHGDKAANCAEIYCNRENKYF